jgi:peroxiredoxin
MIAPSELFRCLRIPQRNQIWYTFLFSIGNEEINFPGRIKRMIYRLSKLVLKLALFIALIGVLLGMAACKITENSTSKLINSPAPDFTLKDLSGNQVSLSGLAGKTVFINFWVTSSPTCVAEMPILQQLYDEWKGRSDAVFLSVNLGEGGDKIRLFLDRHNFTFPVLMDTDWEAGRFYQVHNTPTSCLVDKMGNLRFLRAGAFKDKPTLDKQLAEFISTQP